MPIEQRPRGLQCLLCGCGLSKKFQFHSRMYFGSGRPRTPT